MSVWILKRTSNYIFSCHVCIYEYMYRSLQFSHVSIILQTSECILKYCALTCIICVYIYVIYMWFIDSLNCMKPFSALLFIVLSPFALPSHFRSPSRMKSLFASQHRSHLFNVYFFLIFFLFWKFISADFVIGCKLAWNVISMWCFSIPFLRCLFPQLSNGGGAASFLLHFLTHHEGCLGITNSQVNKI